MQMTPKAWYHIEFFVEITIGAKKLFSQEIKFIYHNKLAYEMSLRDSRTTPRPSKNFIPKWYKDMSPYDKSESNPSGRNISIDSFLSNATAKKCTPMLDGMSAGYIVPLWCDVQVKQEKNKLDNKFYPKISWRIDLDVFEIHGQSSRDVAAPIGYDQIVFKFLTYFNIKTPPGHSISISTPAGHYGLPLYAIPAVIDSDKSVIDNNFPCWIQTGFEGVLEKGMPIAQVVPFKRTNWKINILERDFLEHKLEYSIGFDSNIINNYVRNIWSKKDYS
jgi:hypothetical protein